MSDRNLPVKAHAELGASTASRWMACPGSIRLTRGLPNPETEYSREGTAAHRLGELALRKEKETYLWTGMELENVVVTEEMAENVKVYVDHCRELIASDKDAIFWIERPFNLQRLNPPGDAEMFGTPDFMIYLPSTRTLHVVDYKNGKGVVVEVTGNKQTRYYGLGGVLSIQDEHPELQIDDVVLTIIQPRAGHVDGPIRSETLDYLELLEFAGDLMNAAARTLDPNAPLVAGNHCRFCPASSRCPAQLALAESIAQVEFSQMLPNVPEHQPPAPELLPSGDLGDMLQRVPILEDWIKAMWAEAARRLEAGEKVEGLKLVAKRAQRNWIDEQEARAVIELEVGLRPEDYEDRRLKSPAQIEKLLGRTVFGTIEGDLVLKRSSGNTVALASDARQEVLLLPGSEFSEGDTPNESVNHPTEEI